MTQDTERVQTDARAKMLGHGADAPAEPTVDLDAQTARDIIDASLVLNTVTAVRGETVALTGRSGCGKSTLLLFAAGLTQADYIDGVTMGTWPVVEGLLFDPDVKTLAW